MPKIDISLAPHWVGSDYPAPYHEPCKGRERWRLALAGGLGQFGVNLLRLSPGAWSSQRHWHSEEEEFVYVLEGEVVLVENESETLLKAGDCAAFPAGVANGHHLQNRTNADALLLEIGSRIKGESADYPDLDMVVDDSGYRHRDGTPYPSRS